MTGPDGYWCELVARSPEIGDEWYLGGTWVWSPGQALDWLRSRARVLDLSLEGTAGEVFLGWSADHAYQRTQRAALEAGRPISVNAGGREPITDGTEAFVFYSLACRPVFLPRQPTPAEPHQPHQPHERTSCTRN